MLLKLSLSVKKNRTEVDKYFTTRLIVAPEVATTMLSFQIAGSTRQVSFLDTNFVEKRRKLKSLEEINELEHGSSNVFCDSLREKYVDRPVELEDVKYPDYLGKLEFFSNYSSISQTRHLHVCMHVCMYTLMPKVDMCAKD